MRIEWAVFATVLLSPIAAQAQTKSCDIPSSGLQIRPERVDPSKVNSVAATGNLLALSWSPQFCRKHGSDPDNVTQCGNKNRFGFILHGLWPDGPGRNDPAFCAPAEALPAPMIRENFCIMPSPKLQQHEWAKHGTCMSAKPEHYFKAASILFNAVKWPDMDRLSRERPTVGDFKARFAARNPGLRPDMMSVQAGKGGWLEEVRICLGKDYRPRSCPREDRGAEPRRALKIWRDER
jgi:ribonuclease T2